MGPREHPTAPVNEMRLVFVGISETGSRRLYNGQLVANPHPNPLPGQGKGINQSLSKQSDACDPQVANNFFNGLLNPTRLKFSRRLSSPLMLSDSLSLPRERVGVWVDTLQAPCPL